MSSESWAKSIFATTVFAEHLAPMKEFYGRVFDLPCVFEGGTSAVFAFGETLINIIDISGAPELIDPAPVAGPNAGARSMFTIRVNDVDALYAQLVDKGVTFLNGPIDRPWGPRTATFADPAGHMWEIAS
ncbi:MAG: VOC family protein [Chloroflexota bacterium]|nr:VOC family protein [Chloroflexota bacterium]